MQIEIPLPDVGGRREILRIHFVKLRGKGRLIQLLCRAIDGAYGADARKYGGGVEGLLITLEDVKQAFVEVRR